jgi:hypothetical protein
MTRDTDPAFADWVAEARAADFARALDLCGFVPARGKGKPPELAGPCPECGGRDRFAVHLVKRKFNCRGCDARGVDALALALTGARLSFVAACEALSGRARPARVGAESEAARAERAERRAAMDARIAADKARRAREADGYRARERSACARIWEAARAPTDACLGRYFAARGLMLPASALLREADDVPFFHGEAPDERGHKVPTLIHRGPAMLALMRDNDGAAVGLHITWLAADWSAKATIIDPETGEIVSPKKMRGTKKASHIVLRENQGPRADGLAGGGGAGRTSRMFIGEGIETVASVATALKLSGHLLPGDAFRAAGDLGNLGGPHLGTLAHPALKAPSGRALRVPGPDPDMTAPAIAIPPRVTHLVLLGDGDSEPVLTGHALDRGRRRALAERARLRAEDPALPPLAVAILMAPAGGDFNDLLRTRAGKATAEAV